MNRRLTKILLAACCLSVLSVSCKDKPGNGDDEVPVTVLTGIVKNISYTTAVTEGVVAGSFIEAGICYSTDNDPTVENGRNVIANVQSSEVAVDFDCELKNLEMGTTYYARAYAVHDNGTVYGDSKLFTTIKSGTPMITDVAVGTVGEFTAEVSATISVQGESKITERGFCYSTSSDEPTVQDSKLVVEGSTGLMSGKLEGLEEKASYTVRGYAIYGTDEVAYGNTADFTTKGVVEVTGVTEYYIHRVVMNMAVGSPSSWTDAGFCWSTSPAPTLDDMSKSVGKPDMAVYKDVVCLGMKPATRYYIRAYVSDGNNVYYSKEEADVTTMQSLFAPNDHTHVSFIFDWEWPTSEYLRNGAYYNDYSDFGPTTRYQMDIFDDLAEAIYDNYGSHDLRNISITTHSDLNGSKIFGFTIYMRYPDGEFAFRRGYFDYHIEIHEDEGFTVTDFLASEKVAKDLLVALDGKTDGIDRIRTFMESGKLYLDISEVLLEEGARDSWMVILFSDAAADDEYFVMQYERHDRKKATLPVWP